MPAFSPALSMSFPHAKPLQAQHLHFNHISNSDYYQHPPGHPSRTSSHNSSLLMMQPHHVQLHHDGTRSLNRVAVFWDYESCRPAGLMPAYTIVDNIRDACLPYGSITHFKAYIERHDSSPYRPPLTHHHSHPQSQPPFHQPSLRDQLQNFGVSLSYYTNPHRSSSVPYSTNRSSYPSTTGVSGGAGPTSIASPTAQSGISSSQLLVDMLLFALDHPAPNSVIILITADELSPHALSALRQRHYTIVLITPKSAIDGQPLRASMAAQANVVLDWAAVMRGAFTGPIAAGLSTAQGTTTPTAAEGNGRRENERTGISGDVDPDHATPTGDDSNMNTLTGVMTTSPSAFSSILHPLAMSPTTRHMTPAGTVSSGGTVVDAPGDALMQGDASAAGMTATQDTQTSHLGSSPFFGEGGADRGQSGSHPLLSGATKSGTNSSISSRPTSRHLSSSALTNPTPLFPASSAAKDHDDRDDENDGEEHLSDDHAMNSSIGSSMLNTQAAPFQPFRAQSTGLGGLGSRSNHQPGSLSRVWGHFPTTSSGTTGPGLGSPLFPVRTLSSGTINAIANAPGSSASRATTDSASSTLTALNTNVGADTGPPSSISTSSSLASPTSSSNWTQSPPLPVPLPTPQHSSVFSPLSGSGIGERMRASSTVSISPTESLARRSSQYHQSQYPTQPQPIPNASSFGNPPRGSNIGFGMSGLGASPINTRESAPLATNLGQSHNQGVQSPRFMSPPPMLTFVPQRQQHQQHGSVGRFQNSQQQQQAAAAQMQQALYAQQPHHPIPRRGITNEQFMYQQQQQQQAMLPPHPQMHTPANRDVPFGHGLHHHGGASGMQPPARPISPRHFGLLINILTEFRNENKSRPYRSKIGSELVQRDRMVYQRAGVSGFKDYVGMAEQMGYVRLGGHSGSPGKEWIELVVPE